jgi:hypothetical protein
MSARIGMKVRRYLSVLEERYVWVLFAGVESGRAKT